MDATRSLRFALDHSLVLGDGHTGAASRLAILAAPRVCARSYWHTDVLIDTGKRD